MSKIKVLFLAANPSDLDSLALEEEIREITSKIRATEFRDSIDLRSGWAVRPDDLLQLLNQNKPQIVHFSGHGLASGEIVLANNNGDSKTLSCDAIKALFRTLKDNIKVVFFNLCYSKLQAKAITEVIDCAIGMNKAIGDKAAIVFAASFYRAIGFGRSIKDAFDQGIVALQLEGIHEEDTPELLVRSGVDPSQIVLIDTPLEYSGTEKSTNEIIDYSLYTKMVLNEIIEEIKTSIGYYIPIYLKEKPLKHLKDSESSDNSKSIMAEQVWLNHNHLIILGEPGSGKSCMLNQLAGEIITKSSFIPIIIKAKFWGFRFNTIIQAIEYVLSSHKVNIYCETIRNELNANKYIILIDGYDEIRNSKEFFESEIISIAQSYTSRLILTSRTANYHGELPGFNRFEIDKLSDDQIDEYAKHTISYSFFSSYLYELKLLELARLPLYLFMLCNIAQDIKKLAKNKSMLQDKFASYLLEDYLIKRIPGYQIKYPLQLKLRFLSKLAEKKTADPLYDNYLQCSKELELIDDPYTLMKEILESGVLKGNYSSFDFIHPTVREFFYARQLLGSVLILL